MNIHELLEDRGNVYADAWKKHGDVFIIFHKELMEFMMECPEYLFAWTMIINKAIRLLASPRHLDSWKDIAGYAQLVVNDLEKRNEEDDYRTESE